MRAILTISLLAAAAAAQAPRAPGEPVARVGGQQPTVEKPEATRNRDDLHTTADHYDDAQSRSMLASCDDNGDDRLDLFEARAAMRDLGDPASPNWFRRLDTDRDGYLDWPEFDRFYREVVQNGGTLHLWLRRPLPQVATVASTGNLAPRRTIDLFDTNHDGGLDIPETQAMLRELGVPPNLIDMAPMLDRDRNGRLDEDELAPAMQQLHIDLLAPPKNASPGGNANSGTNTSALKEPWRNIDLDGNQTIDGKELALALRRIDPQLDRWAAKILQSADRNGDGRLQIGELPAAESTPAMAESGGRR